MGRRFTQKRREQLHDMLLDVGTEVRLDPHDELAGLMKWYVAVKIETWPEGAQEPSHKTVATMTLVRCDFTAGDVAEALDADSEDLSMFIRLLDVNNNMLLDEFEMAGLGGLLIVDRVAVEDEWRGYGLGAYWLGLAIKAVSGDSTLAALTPYPTDVPHGSLSKEDEAAAVAKIGKAYAKIGFQRHDDEIMVLPLDDLTFPEQMVQLGRRFNAQ